MAEETGLAKSNDTNALAQIQAVVAGAIQPAEQVFDSVSKSVDYLCRMQLCGSNSKLFKKNKIAKGNYAYIVAEDNFTDLGASVDIFPICWRPKALDMSGESPVAIYDVNSAEFKDISARSMQQNSECTFGPEFLVWIPVCKKFASVHFGSKTSRKDAGDLRALLGKGATMTHRIVENEKYVWEAMVINACSTPFELPQANELQVQIDKFQAEASQKAPEKADATSRAR